MSIASEITRINDAKEALKTSINNKLGSQTLISDEKIDEYSSFVDNIQNSTQQPYFGIPESASESDLSNLLVTDRILELPVLNTSKLENANRFVYNFTSLKKIPLLDFSKVINLTDAFRFCANLTDVGGFDNLGAAYAGSTYANLDLSYSPLLTVNSACKILSHLANVYLITDIQPSVIFAKSLETTFTANSDFMAQLESAEGYGWSVTFK